MRFFEHRDQAVSERAPRVVGFDERRPGGGERRAMSGVRDQALDRRGERGAVPRRHHLASARGAQDLGRIAAHRGHDRAPARQIVEQLDRNGFPREFVSAGGGHARVGGVDHLDQLFRGNARAEFDVGEARLGHAALEPRLGHPVADQQEADIVTTLKARGRIEQHVHAVHQPVGAGVEHRERAASVALGSWRESLGVGAVGDQLDAARRDTAALELALHARRHRDQARGARVEESGQRAERGSREPGLHLSEGDRGSRPVVAHVDHQRRGVADGGEPGNHPEKEWRSGREHHVRAWSAERDRERAPRKGGVIPQAGKRCLSRGRVQPHALDREPAIALRGATHPGVLGADHARRMIRKPGHHPHLVPRAFEGAREMQRASRCGAGLGRPVLGDEQDTHRSPSLRPSPPRPAGDAPRHDRATTATGAAEGRRRRAARERRRARPSTAHGARP